MFNQQIPALNVVYCVGSVEMQIEIENEALVNTTGNKRLVYCRYGW